MEYFALIVLCPLAGFFFVRRGIVSRDGSKAINTWVLYIAIPALSLRYIPEITWHAGMLLPIAGPLLIWAGAWLWVRLYATRHPVDAATRAALLLTCGLGNTAFLGFPMTTAFFGLEALPVAVVFDLATFIIFCTLGVMVVFKATGDHQPGLRSTLARMFFFPPFLTAIIALIPKQYVDFSVIYPLLDLIVPTVSPLALFSLGMQLEFRDYGESVRHLGVGLSYKLLLAPLLIALLALVLPGAGQISRASILEGGMSSHITASLMASQFNLNPRLCGLMVASGIILSLITTTLWWLVSGMIF